MATTNTDTTTTRTVIEPLLTFDPTLHFHTSIKSIATSSQSFIYLGTSSGSLLLLSINPDTPNDKTPSTKDPKSTLDDPNSTLDFDVPFRNVSFIKSVSFGDSAVETVLLLDEIGKVIVLSDGFLFLTDSGLVQPVKKLGFLKGVSFITKRVKSSESECSDLSGFSSLEGSSASSRILSRLGGGVRGNGVKDFVQKGEGDYVFAVVAGKKLMLIELRVVPNDKEVDLLVLKEMQCIDGVKTIVWINDSIIVGTVIGYSLFSCITGQSGVIFTLPDVSNLPFLKLLWKEKKVLLLVDNVGIIADEHGQPVGGSLVFRKGPDSVGELASYVIVVRDGKLELYHKKSGDRVQTVSFGSEGSGPCIVADEESGNGKLVAVATPTKVIFYRRVPTEEQIKDLLRKKNFKEAVSLVEELKSDGEISNEMLSFVHAQIGFLLLFDLHFEEAVNHFLQSETMQPSEIFPFIMRDPNRWSLLVPRNRYWGLHPPPAPLEDVVDDGLMAIQRAIFLKKAGVDTTVHEDFVLNPPTRADLLELAIKNMSRYLEVSREKELTLSVREGVDTLLMYLYRALNRIDDMERLASSGNSCIVEELETLLDESGHLRTLAFLYASKGMSSKALTIWRILAKNYSSGLWKDPALEHELPDGNTNVISGREVAATEASKILEELCDQDLVLQHLGWIADVNPALTVQVLTSEKRVDQLSPVEVIASIDPKKVEILQRYLQWLIEDQDACDSQFHTLYALSLAKSAIESFEVESTSQEPDEGRLEETFITLTFSPSLSLSLSPTKLSCPFVLFIPEHRSMASSAWRKLKKSLKSKLSFLSTPTPTPTPTNPTTDDNARITTATPPPVPTSSSSSSFSARLSRSFSLHSSSKKCAICLRSLRKGQGQAIFYAECSHPFHFNCIADSTKHGNLKCPICRSKWKDVPFQAPRNVPNFQRTGSVHAHVPPYNAPPVQIEAEHFSDDEVLSDVPSDESLTSRPQAITVKTFTEYPAVSASESFSKFGVLARVRAPPLDNTLPHHRAPIDVVTVLDVSGSMASKLILLKRAVNFIIQNLGPSDRLSIVTFSSSARRMLPLRRMSGSGREDATSVVDSISAIGGTNIVAGLKKGVQVLEERRQHNSVATIILLSDGCDTQSHNAQNRLEYLKSLPASIFPSNNTSREGSKQPTFPVYTFGFGSDHDSSAMHAISEASHGTFSFIESINILQDAFARCFGGLVSIVARHVQLKVKSASPGVQILSIPSGRHKNKIFDQGHQAVIDIGDMYAEEEKEFLVFLSIPVSPVVDGEERLANTSLVDVSCFHKGSVSMDTVQVEGERVQIRRPPTLSPTDQVLCLEVDRQRNRLLVTETIAKTQRMAEMGDLKGAQALLAKQLSTLLTTASSRAGDDLCNQLEAELKETRERMETRELYERSGRAYVLSGMSSHSWQRAATRGHYTAISSEGGNSDTRTTTSYETPSMTSMVLKSQILNLAPRE